ncbi:MAG: histone deacetylase [Candidatus Sumerlaeia bacterium]
MHWILAAICLVLASPAWCAADGAPPARTGILIYDGRGHVTPEGFPESATRIEAIEKRLTDGGLLDRAVRFRAKAATDDELKLVHGDGYIERARAACAAGKPYLDRRDVPISKGSEQAAREAAGSVLGVLDAVMAGRIDNAFCAIRPPGHHAGRDQAMGFCIYNNAAIAARYLQQKHKVKRILIVDWDVHHGNGTQAAFEADPTVFYFSVHQAPFYPGTGAADDAGTTPAAGTKLNVPLPAGSGDKEAIAALRDRLMPAANKFKPDFILISAGFDAHADDPIGGLMVSSAGYAELTRVVKKIADQQCHGRLVSLLEGGYNPQALAQSAEAHSRTLME